eukprot:m.172502 g.172502  ORF g.172502 m.172502 type:complete len:58 (+) comp16519_c0_seq1:2557-2730(+)
MMSPSFLPPSSVISSIFHQVFHLPLLPSIVSALNPHTTVCVLRFSNNCVVFSAFNIV